MRRSLDARRTELALKVTSGLLEAAGANPLAPVAPMVPIQCLTKGQGVDIVLSIFIQVNHS